MSKYKVGDIVKVRDGLETSEKYGGIIYIDQMYGEALEIAEVDLFGTESWYKVYCGPHSRGICSYIYSEEMFEGLTCDCFASKPEPKSETTYMRYDDALDVVYIRIGSMTLCVPQRAPMGIARKNPKDEECVEIGEALAYQRMILQSVAKEDK